MHISISFISDSTAKLSLKGLKNQTGGYNEDDDTIIFNSSNPNNPPIVIKDIHIKSFSDIFDPKKDYVGFIVYLCGKKNDFELGGVHCKTGDIFIKESDWIQDTVRERNGRGKYMHGRLFYSIFGRWKKKKQEFIGGGFSYHDGKWKFNSGTFNTMNSGNNNDTYHNSDRKLAKAEKELLENVIMSLYENHEWMKRSADERVSLRELTELKELAEPWMNHTLDLRKIHNDRRLHGTVISFNYERHYGFIQCIGIKEDIFVDFSETRFYPSNSNDFMNGTNIELDITETSKGWKAINVTGFRYYC